MVVYEPHVDSHLVEDAPAVLHEAADGRRLGDGLAAVDLEHRVVGTRQEAVLAEIEPGGAAATFAIPDAAAVALEVVVAHHLEVDAGLDDVMAAGLEEVREHAL